MAEKQLNKSEEYLRMSERAAENIKKWPKWMQRNLNPPKEAQVIDAKHLAHQRLWSELTFGPGARTKGVLDHIRKELHEIEEDPADLFEWVDVIILAFDGAWRAGWEPQEIIDAIKEKQAKNETRIWPDWREQSEDEAITHVKEV